MIGTRFYRSRPFLLSIWLMFALSLAACQNEARPPTVVTGKVVYGEMAMEGAEITVKKWNVESEKWETMEVSRSGYHGSFRLHLAEGSYRIEASTTVRVGEDLLVLSGNLVPLNISKDKRRMDRLIVELSAAN